ncbi:MAG: hypothetical protein ACRDX8_12515, partial [Acidimicrobiales bacterium]
MALALGWPPAPTPATAPVRRVHRAIAAVAIPRALAALALPALALAALALPALAALALAALALAALALPALTALTRSGSAVLTLAG